MALHLHLHLLISATFFLLLATAGSSRSVVSSDGPVLHRGTTLTAGSLALKFTSDCSLKLFDNGTLVETFFTPPTGKFKSGCILYVNKHGVVKVQLVPGGASTPVFGSRSRTGHYALIVGNGKLGVYGDSIWTSLQSISSTEPITLAATSLFAADTTSVLFSDNLIAADSNGNRTVAASGDSLLVLEPKCNLAVVKKNEIIWESKTTHNPANAYAQCQLILRTDGELVLGELVPVGVGDSDPVFDILWSSGVSSDAGSHAAVLTGGGEFVVYGLKDTVYQQKSIEIEMVTE